MNIFIFCVDVISTFSEDSTTFFKTTFVVLNNMTTLDGNIDDLFTQLSKASISKVCCEILLQLIAGSQNLQRKKVGE